MVVPAFIIYRKSAEHVYENHPALYILAFGMVAAKVTNRLVVGISTIWNILVRIVKLNVLYLMTPWIVITGCAYDKKWNAIFRQFTYWSSNVILESVFQFLYQRILHSLVVLCKFNNFYTNFTVSYRILYIYIFRICACF